MILHKNRIVLAFLAIFSFSSICAQEGKKDIRYKVFATELECKEQRWIDAGYTTQVNESILTNLKATKRANVYTKGSAKTATEATKDANIKLTLGGSDEFMWDAAGFEKPDFTLSGAVTKVKFINLGIKGYQAVVSFTVKVTEVSTGDILDQMDFVGEKAKAEMSKASAFPAALKQTNEALQDYFKSLFNLRTTIYSIVDNSKTAAKTVKINLNKRSGVNTKDQFIVKEVVYEDGEAVDENEIGLLRVKEVGNKTTLCQVTKGGKQILSLFDKANREAIICELKQKRR